MMIATTICYYDDIVTKVIVTTIGNYKYYNPTSY